MKSVLTRRSIIIWMLIFLWMEVLIFRGTFGWMEGIRFPFLFLLAIAFYHPEFWVLAPAFAAGIFMDALSAVPVHTPVMVGAYYAAGLTRRLFYYQGSPAHIASFFPVVLLGILVVYSLVPGAGLGLPFSLWHLFKLGILNFVVFLIMLLVFQKKDQAVMYKMSR